MKITPIDLILDLMAEEKSPERFTHFSPETNKKQAYFDPTIIPN